MNKPLTVGYEGWFQLTVRDAKTLRVKRELPPFKNLVLDQGLERLGTASAGQGCQVGAGNSAPTNTQTGLDVFIARTTNRVSNQDGAQPSPPYFGWSTFTFRFAAGTAAGTLREIGIDWAAGNNLFSRALIVDVNGNPASITVLSDEVLDVTYQIRMYPDLTTGAYVVDVGGVSTTFTVTPANLTSASYWGTGILSAAGFYHANSFYGTNGSPGPITGEPSGVGAGSASCGAQAYVPGSRKRTITAAYDLNNGNVAGGISAAWAWTNKGSYQFSIVPAIPKTSDRVLTLTFELAWGRLP